MVFFRRDWPASKIFARHVLNPFARYRVEHRPRCTHGWPTVSAPWSERVV